MCEADLFQMLFENRSSSAIDRSGLCAMSAKGGKEKKHSANINFTQYLYSC